MSAVHWTHALIHHSFTGDSTLPDSVAIRRFHTSHRQGGTIITPEEYAERKALGEDSLVAPWKDAGYHWFFERLSDGRVWLIQGRPMHMNGAHCPQQGMNRHGIGLCAVGNFDDDPPADDLLNKVAETTRWLCRMHGIPVENVRPHREYATYKSCPGKKFDMDDLRARIAALE